MPQSSVTADQDQLHCLICRHLLEVPVTIPSGHTFCKDCIEGSWHWNDLTGIYNCSQCSETFSPRPVLNRNEILNKKISEMNMSGLGGAEGSSSVGSKRKASGSPGLPESTCMFGMPGDTVCSLHHKPLEVYCLTDLSSICSECVKDMHQHHAIVSVQDETKERQKQLTAERTEFQKKLRQRERRMLENRMRLEAFRGSAWSAVKDFEGISKELIQAIEKRCSEVKERIRMQEEAAVGEAQRLLLLTEQEMAEISGVDSELERISHTMNPIHFLQKWPLPTIPAEPSASQNLAVDQQLPFKVMTAALSDLKQQLGDMCDAGAARVSHAVDKPSSAPGPSAVPEDPEPSSRPMFLQYARHLTFDPNTANCELTLSAEGREVTRGHRQCYVNHPERFSSMSQVLCKEVLSDGRFYWEAELEGSKAEVAVTYRGISRKGTGPGSSFGANDQSWCLECINGAYSTCHKTKGFKILALYCPRVGVYLDHRAGILSFYSISDTVTLLHRYQTTFHEPVFAGFWVGPGTTIKLCQLQQ